MIFRLIFCTLAVVALSSLPAVEIKEASLKIVSGKIRFTGETQVETVRGSSEGASGQVDLATKTIEVRVPLEKFQTGNSMRDDNMHEDFLETAKFPEASFSGKLNSYDPATGVFTATGSFTVHGVAKRNLKVTGKISASKNGYVAKVGFQVFLKDHKIAIPKVLFVEMENKIEVEAELFLQP